MKIWLNMLILGMGDKWVLVDARAIKRESIFKAISI